jgi:Fic family protein
VLAHYSNRAAPSVVKSPRGSNGLPGTGVRPGDPRAGDRWAFWYFEPTSIPRNLVLDAPTVLALSEADAALGHLHGLGHLITDPQLLIGPYVTREALASSRIEGTQASLAEVLQAGAEVDDTERTTDDVAEVQSYVRATYRGLELIKTLPITQRLVLDVHRVLLTGVRGEDRMPGELRRSPVWVGSPTDSPDTALFVPPLPEHLGDLLADWERYVNEPGPQPALVRCALMHYQFETIHPFLDGNGRISRLLIGLLLHQQGRLTTPLLYLSGYLETHRREYYERLQAVRERGEIQQWLQFFLTAVERQAEDGVDRAGQLVRVREEYVTAAARSRSRVGEAQAVAEYGDEVPAEVEADYHRFTVPTGTHWRRVTPGGCCCAAGGNHWPAQRPPTSARPRPARPRRSSRASLRRAIRTVPASPVAGSKQV